MTTSKYLIAPGDFGSDPNMSIPHMVKGQRELRLWRLSGRVHRMSANSCHRLISLWNQGRQPWVLTSSNQHTPPWLQGGAPWCGDCRSLHEVLSWRSLHVGCLGILTRVLSTLFWIAHHQGWHSNWPSILGIRLHSRMMATPPELENSCRGSSNLVPLFLRP